MRSVIGRLPHIVGSVNDPSCPSVLWLVMVGQSVGWLFGQLVCHYISLLEGSSQNSECDSQYELNERTATWSQFNMELVI